VSKDAVKTQETKRIIQDLMITRTLNFRKESLNHVKTSDSLMLVVSGNKAKMNTILVCNSLSNEFLGYSKNELVGSKLDKIIPKEFRKSHQKGMTNYINDTERFKLNLVHSVYAINKRQELTMLDLEIRITPDFSQGVKLLGIMKQVAMEDIFSQ
jgi:PAS domain S-box-containing protein